jgi:hypothetical protein
MLRLKAVCAVCRSLAAAAARNTYYCTPIRRDGGGDWGLEDGAIIGQRARYHRASKVKKAYGDCVQAE